MILWMQKHRKYLVVTLWISVIAFVGAGFIGWGAYNFSSIGENTIAKVGTIKVTQSDLQRKYSKIYNYYDQMMGGKLTKERAKQLRLQDIAIEQLFNDTLLLNYAKDLGLDVSDKEILQNIANIPAFQVDGKFSESRFNSILRSLGTSVKEFKKGIKETLLIQKLFSALKLPNTKTEEETIFAALYLQDNLDIKTIDKDSIKVTISDDELKKYWQENKQKYKSKTKYLVDIVKVDAKTLTPNEQDIKEFYEAKKFLFKDKDGKILPFEKTKDEVAKKVQMKMAKKEILKKYLKFKSGKIKAEESLELTRFDIKIPMQEIVDAKPNSFVKAIKTSDGYICAKVKDIVPPKELSFEKAKDLVYQDLLSIKSEEALKQRAKEELKELKDAKNIGFITRDDYEKLNFLTKPQAVEFLNYLFSTVDKKGFYIFSDKAVVYSIKKQKLYDKSLFEKNRDKVANGVKNTKLRILEDSLLKKLKQKYKIEKYYKN